MRLAGSQEFHDQARWRVFISHTSELRDFPEGTSYIAAVERAIAAAGHVIVDMADFAAADQAPAQLCAARVRGCDVYVGVLGTRYGSPVRDKPQVSYTELEFDTATEAGLDRLVFLLDTHAADVGIPVSALMDRKFGARQDAFRRRVQDSGLITQSFANPDALRRLVGDSLRELMAVKGTPPGPRKLGGSGPRRPGSLPRVWNLPARNPAFTGRDELLAAVRERLLAGDKAVVQAFQGMGGVGKTQLAAEYAYRFAGAYDLAWWVNAEQAGLIGDQFAALGAALGCLPPGADTEVVRAEVLGELRERERWLLVFDNAQTPADITGWLPGGGGHVLITSRERNWVEVAASVEVDVLARPESAAILQGRVSGLTEVDADRLADELGDLPLAVTQAAGFMAEAGVPAGQYLDLLRTQPKRLLGSYPTSLAAATQLITDRLDHEDPAAAQLARLCAFLAPEPILLEWFTNAAGALPELIAAYAADPLAWAQLLRRIGRSSLGRIDERSLQMHRLTQAILRDGLTPDQARTTREQAGEILAASHPGTADDFATWPVWARLVPHVLAVDPGAPMHGANLRDLACGASWYLLMRGDTRSGYELSRDLRAQWLGRLGGDDQDTLRASTRLAAALRTMERYQEARELDEDTLARRRHLWGDDDSDTLISAGCLAADLRGLGKVGAALELNQHNLTRRRGALGADHPDTLGSATCVARDLAASGKVQQAREFNEDTLTRRRRVLGYDHLSTLLSARSLITNLRALGEEQAADDLDRDTRARLQRVAKGIDPDRIREHEPEDVRRRP